MSEAVSSDLRAKRQLSAFLPHPRVPFPKAARRPEVKSWVNEQSRGLCERWPRRKEKTKQPSSKGPFSNYAITRTLLIGLRGSIRAEKDPPNPIPFGSLVTYVMTDIGQGLYLPQAPPL